MDLDKQVCSVELGEELAYLGFELGYPWKHKGACWRWLFMPDGTMRLTPLPDAGVGDLSHPAFTVAELSELLSDYLYTYRARIGDVVTWFGNNGTHNVVEARTEADAKAKLLIWQIKNGIDRNGMADPFLLPDSATDQVGFSCDKCCRCGEDGGDRDISGAVGCDVDYQFTYHCQVPYMNDDTPTKEIGGSKDVINHPSHYTSGGMEVIDFIEAKQLGFHLGNAVKYIARAGKKDDYVEDLKKAYWYVERAIQNDSDRYADVQDKQLTEDFIIAKVLSYLLGYALQHIVDAGADNYVSYDLKKALGYIKRAIDAGEG